MRHLNFKQACEHVAQTFMVQRKHVAEAVSARECDLI